MFIIPLAAAVVLLAIIVRTLIHDLSTDGRGRTPLPSRFGWDDRTKITTR